MNDHERATLVNHLISTWPAGVKAYVWTEALTGLDHAHAHTAYLRLRDSCDRAPSVARLLTEYHAIKRDARAHSEAPSCSDCDGTGWVNARTLVVAEGTPWRREYRQAKPCYCTAGDDALKVQAQLDAARARHPSTSRAVETVAQL